MNFEHAQSLLKIAFEGYDGDKVDLIRALNEMLVKSQQTCEDVVHVADNDSEPVVVKDNKREIKITKKKPKKIPTTIVNEIEKHGFRDGKCEACVWTNPSKDNWKTITHKQCDNDSISEGLCEKHKKQWVKLDGGLRCGRCRGPDDVKFTENTLGKLMSDEWCSINIANNHMKCILPLCITYGFTRR